MAELTNLALLVAEASLYFVVMTALFRARHRFGIGLFFCALGAMHFLETYLAAILYLNLPGGMIISPGSVILFSGKLLLLLLVYIREDAATVRQPIYGLFIGNFLMVGLVLLMRHHIVVMPGGAERLPDFAFMDEMGWLMVWGTTLLFIDAIMIVLLYERTRSWFGDRPTLRILVSSITVLTFDQIGFFTALHLFVGLPLDAFWGGWIAKMAAATFYSGLTGLYLHFMERPGTRRRRTLTDVFDILTYRERYERLLRETGRDSLTGLLDRGRLDRDGAEAITDALGRRRPLSLLIIDIDHFKRINDAHGHSAGDEVLRAIAREMELAVRDGDRVYRYGGEEFVVLCEGLPHTAAILVAERLRLGIGALAFPGIDQTITASVGVATVPEDGSGLGLLFAAADGRLYAAKAAGRDRVVGWPAPPANGASVVRFG